jgi:arginyl-tRNA synthetase
MVDLPSGKMKSREGTVVDADDLMEEMVSTAKNIAKELGKLDGMSDEEADILYETVGMGALKYFMLKVDPRKRMLFDPKESIDFNGNTGPFIQYTYARIQSLKRKHNAEVLIPKSVEITNNEQEIIKQLMEFPSTIQEAAANYSPALMANYVYELVKEYNTYYQNTAILTAESEELINFRLGLSVKVGEVIKTTMSLLAVNVPDRM